MAAGGRGGPPELAAGPDQGRATGAGCGGGGELFRSDHAMRAEAAEGAVSETKNYSCECCGAPCIDGSRRWCAECRRSKFRGEMNSVEAATSPWWQEPDGVLVRVRGDADVVREIVSLKGW